MKKTALILAIGTLISASAMAADDFYAGANIGRGKLEADAGNGFNISKTDTSWDVFGGVKLNPNFAAEIGYRDLGDAKFSESGVNGKLSATAMQVSALGILPISNEVEVFGRLGLAHIKGKSEFSGAGLSIRDSESKNRAVMGIGAKYNLSKDFSLRTEYTSYAKIDDVRLSNLSVGAQFNF